MTGTDRRSAFFTAYDHAASMVERVEPSQLRGPTPCPDYDVATLVDHLVGAGERAVALGRGERPSGVEFPHVELAGAPEQLRRAGEQARRAWAADSSLDAKVEMPWGETYDGATLVDMYLAELAAHTWDLAFATGNLEHLDDRLAPTALDGARAMLKPQYRNLQAPGSPFGSEVEPPAGAGAWERFAAFMGRSPAS